MIDASNELNIHHLRVVDWLSTHPRDRMFTDTFQKEFECPVCMRPYAKKIILCPIGHAICQDCHPKLPDRKCPKCRIVMEQTQPSRNLSLECLRDELFIPCPNPFCKTPVAPWEYSASNPCQHHVEFNGEFNGYQYVGQWKNGVPDGQGKGVHKQEFVATRRSSQRRRCTVVRSTW